ncbi:MAG: hypothetical protein K6T80_01510 [Firmicutes bacterium]|nr:hypothetical protein [Bacillota bacterium]
MPVELRKVVRETVYHDPNKNFELVRVPSEVRYDPLSGDSTRVFPFRQYKLPRFDWTPTVELSREKFCPFCPSVLEKATPRFPEYLVPGGHLKAGEAQVIPNMFPCEPYAGVVVMTPEHYLPMDGIPENTLVDSLEAGFQFLKMVRAHEAGNDIAGSINWNYMPHGGGSIIHPHLQVMAGQEPTNYHGAVLSACENYRRNGGGNLAADLLAAEITAGERYLGRTGNVHWLMSFAPRGMCDVTAVFEGVAGVEDAGRQTLTDFARGVQFVLKYYDSVNISGFNAAVYPGLPGREGYWMTARLAGRFVLPPFGGSDMTQYQVLHGVTWSFMAPENVADSLRIFFNSGSGSESQAG